MFSLYVNNLLLTVIFFILVSWACYLPFSCGQLYNGPAFCAAISGYFAAYVTKCFHWPVLLGFFGGIVLAGLFALGLSLILAPFTGFQMAVATMALIFIIQTVLKNLDFLGGVVGMSGFPEIKNLLVIGLVSVVIVLILLHRLHNSRWGRAMEAVDVDSEMARSMGIDAIKMSIVIQTISGTIGGLAGGIYTFALGTVHPEIFGFGLLLYTYTIIIVGGRHTPWGPLFFAPILWLIPEFVPAGIVKYRNFMFGAIIIVFLLAMPEGVITKGLVRRIKFALVPKKAEGGGWVGNGKNT